MREVESSGKEIIFAMDLISQMIKLLGKYQGYELIDSLYFRIPKIREIRTCFISIIGADREKERLEKEKEEQRKLNKESH